MYSNYQYQNIPNYYQQKPEKIRLAIQLMYIDMALIFFHGLITLFQLKRIGEIFITLFILIFVLIINWLFIYYISRRSNLARIIYTALTGAGILFGLLSVFVQPFFEAVFTLGMIGLDGFIIFLLFHKTSSLWFNSIQENNFNHPY